MKFRFKQEDIKASTTYSKRYLLTPEGQKAFDVMRKLGGGVWHVGTSYHNCNLITSGDNYTKEEVADKVAEIKAALKAAGIYNAVASVESYYNGGYDEPDNMKVTITMKKAYSNSEVLSSMKFRFSPEDIEASEAIVGRMINLDLPRNGQEVSFTLTDNAFKDLEAHYPDLELDKTFTGNFFGEGDPNGSNNYVYFNPYVQEFWHFDADEIASWEPVEACDSIMAADEGKKSMEEVVEDKLDNLADNFDYAVAGLEKLCRDGNCEAAMNIINSIADSLDASIAQIGDAVSSEA